MEKELKRLVRILKGEYALLWILSLLLATLYECDLLPQGIRPDRAIKFLCMSTNASTLL